MRSVTASLDYLRTLSHNEVFCYALICCTLPSIFSFICYFIELLYSVEGIRRSLMIGGVLVIPGIITCGLYISSIKPHTSRFLPLFLSIICCFTLISTSLYGEITSPVTWVTLSLGGYLLLQLLYNPSLIPINTRSSLVIRYTPRGSITSSHRYGISLIFALVISMILTVLIRDESLVSRSQMMLYVVFVFVKFDLREFLCSTVEIGLEWSDSISWSHLPPDIVQLIVEGTTTFKDYVAATGVSQYWRSARSCIGRVPQQPPPELMLSEAQDMRTLFSLDDHSRHRLRLSEVRGKRIWGSQHGWVVTLGPLYVTQLVHLMTGKRISLPPLDAIRRLAPREEWFCLVHKFILLKDPTDESTFLVIAISGPMNSLAFTRVRVETALNRRGEGEWVVVANPENLKFKDVAHFNDKIYALCDNGKLVRFEPDAHPADMVRVIADHPQDVGAHRKIYLVESLGNLYGVFRNGFLDSEKRTHVTTSFFVYKFNFNASAWEEVKHLGDQAFFVGDGNSFSCCLPTSIIPSRSNSIYLTWLFRRSTSHSRSNCICYTDDQWDWQKYPRILAFGGHDVGVFDMKSRDIQPLAFGKDKPRFYSRPFWVTRNPKLHSCSQQIWRSARSCIGRVLQHFPTSTIRSRRNNIYFTDDQWDWQVGVFEMASRDIQPLAFGKDKPRFYPRPIYWVTPSRNLI